MDSGFTKLYYKECVHDTTHHFKKQLQAYKESVRFDWHETQRFGKNNNNKKKTTTTTNNNNKTKTQQKQNNMSSR
jgi:hypothetical protein